MSVLAVCQKVVPRSLSRFNIFFDFRKCFPQTTTLCSFYESSKRGGDYPVILDQPWQELAREIPKAFVGECKLFIEEMREKFLQDPKFYADGDTDVFWRFDSEDCLKQWRIGSDKVHKEGFSECNLIINDKKKAVFYGNVDLTLPKDGKVAYAGYCGIKSVSKKKSFFRDDWYNFLPFSHLELRVKGDGRNYYVNLGLGMYFDVSWFDTYTYALYTHGGPYWQVVRIPFSKFFRQSKGRLQDNQCPIPLNKVNSVGITCAGVAGPFRLEIDYIGCHLDLRHKEEFAYEMYKLPKELVSS